MAGSGEVAGDSGFEKVDKPSQMPGEVLTLSRAQLESMIQQAVAAALAQHGLTEDSPMSSISGEPTRKGRVADNSQSSTPSPGGGIFVAPGMLSLLAPLPRVSRIEAQLAGVKDGPVFAETINVNVPKSVVSLAKWGGAVITQGRTHKGKKYMECFEDEKEYASWTLIRFQNLDKGGFDDWA